MSKIVVQVACESISKRRRLLHRIATLSFVATILQAAVSVDLLADTAQKPNVPNIVLILADDLGYGDLGCYGQERIRTPNIDRLAKEGMRFTDFYAGSTVCAPSRCVLMTGYHTGHCLIRGNAKSNLRPEDVTMAEVLKSAGYETALAGKWGLGHEGSTGTPNKQGFDYFYGYLDQTHAHNFYPSFLVRNEARVLLKNVVPNEGRDGQGVASKKEEYSHDLIMNEALNFIDEHHKKPFFLYLALTIPHANNEAGAKGMEVPELGEYADKPWSEPEKGHAAMMGRMDRDVGRLMAKLKELKLDENTIVFFTSDNGPHAEGGHNPNFNKSSGPLHGIKRSLHDGGIRVPLIARWPGKIAAGSETNFIGGFQDFMPTLAALAGAKRDSFPEDCDGISFLPTLLGEKNQSQHDHLYWVFYEGQGGQAIRRGKWKGVQQPNHSPLRLYDLSTDLGEQNNVAAQHPDVVEKLRAAMAASYVPSEEWKLPKAKRSMGE